MTQLKVLLPPLSCGTCTECCQEPPHLQEWENPLQSHFEGAKRVWNKVLKKWTFQLPASSDGSCINRMESAGSGGDVAGCAIYENRPHVCREFDCRRWILAFNRKELKRQVANDEMPQSVIDAGRSRLKEIK